MSLKGIRKSDGTAEYIYADDTLSEENAPGEAKAAGDRIAGVEGRVTTLETAAPEIISNATKDWLDDNVTPTGSAVAIDSSLTQSGLAADAKAAGDAVNDLKSELNAVYDVALGENEISSTLNYAVFTSQKITYWDTGAYSIAYIPCEAGKAYHITKDIDTTKFDIAYATTPLALNTPVYGFVSLQGTAREFVYIPGTGATFLLVQTQGNISHVVISEYVGKYDDDIADINADIDTLNTIASETTNSKYVETNETNIEPNLTFTTGYMAKNGSVQTSGITTLEYSNKIEVAPTNIIRSSGDGFRFVCAFNGNTAVEAKGSESTNEYLVPDGIDHVVLTRYKTNSGVAINQIETELRYYNILNQIPMGYLSKVGSMANGDVISLLYHNVKNKNRYVFNANITTLGSIKFQKGTSDYITVSQSGIAIHNDQGTINVAFPEGFSITHDITLVVENDESIYLSKLTVESVGNVFNADVTTAPIRFLMDTGTPSVESVGSVLTNCRFSWVSENVNAPIWIFGDSYVSWYDVRWVYYAVQDDNLKSTLLSGYAGEGSGDAMSGLENLLKITTPKIVVWCLGMNNGDTDSAVNSAWLNNYNKLIELSEQYGFEIVLYTTPTTPTINNNFKNAIIRDSGYRYIEADLAVRIDAEGHWVGYGTDHPALSTDNVHPTEIGAKILYYRFLADLPELMSK